MQGMISQDGATLLFPTSYGYFSPHILDVAKKYPDVRFARRGRRIRVGHESHIDIPVRRPGKGAAQDSLVAALQPLA